MIQRKYLMAIWLFHFDDFKFISCFEECGDIFSDADHFPFLSQPASKSKLKFQIQEIIFSESIYVS